MARFNVGGPTENAPAPGRPGVPSAGSFGAESTEGIDRGIQTLARGVSGLSDGIGMYAERERKKRQVADYAKAEALWTAGTIEIGNAYSRSTDFGGMAAQADKTSLALKEKAAALISDEEARDAWLADAEQRRLHIVDGASDRAYVLQQENQKAEFANSLATSAEVIADPSIDEGTRGLARKQIEGTLQMGLDNGLILPAEATRFRRDSLDAAEESLAINRATLGILQDPLDVMNGLAIPLSNHASTAAQSMLGVYGGSMNIPVDVAGLVAQRIGDMALPSDPKLAEAYLKDPDINARYATGMVEMLGTKFKGDMTAAVVATAPGGSMEMAERWVKSGHDEGVLPDGVRSHYRKVMNGMTPEAPLVRLPIVATNSVNLEDYDIAVLDRFEKLQSAFGTPMTVMSGPIDPKGRSITLDIKRVKEEERARLVGMASAMGFTGITLGKDSLTLDTGERRLVPADGKLPKWAKDLETGHAAGQFTSFEQTVHAVAPEYADIPFDKRLKLYEAAKAESERRGIEMKSGIAVAVDNAPVAMAQFGEYTGVMPTVDDFVHAYGARDGIERFKAFDASMDAAELAFGMRTMSAGDIADAVEAAQPTSRGDMAAVEGKKFAAVTAAATSIIQQRKDDPVGYVSQAFPNVAAAWEAAMEKDGDVKAALIATAEAQESLGMPLELLPKAVAEAAAVTFNNAEIPQADRIGAVVQMIASTNDVQHQEAIFNQLVKAGVPKQTQGAFAVMMRPGADPGAAERLFQAAMFDPTTVVMRGADNTSEKLKQQIQEQIFDEGEIGDVFYGLTDGTAENIAYATNDSELFLKSVQLRLATGQASDASEAIKQTALDRFGDVQVVTGKAYGGGAGARVTLPKGEDAKPYRMGFNGLLPDVGEAFMNYLTPEIAGMGLTKTELFMATAGRDYYVSQVLEEGYFSNAGDNGFVFINPYTSGAIPGADGKPLVFTREQVMSAGMAADAQRRANPAFPGMGGR